jgi:hypothetical protein
MQYLESAAFHPALARWLRQGACNRWERKTRSGHAY